LTEKNAQLRVEEKKRKKGMTQNTALLPTRRKSPPAKARRGEYDGSAPVHSNEKRKNG